MATAPDDFALVMDVDVVPASEGGGHLRERLGIGTREVVTRRIGEHDAKTERVIHPIAFVNHDLA